MCLAYNLQVFLNFHYLLTQHLYDNSIHYSFQKLLLQQTFLKKMCSSQLKLHPEEVSAPPLGNDINSSAYSIRTI